MDENSQLHISVVLRQRSVDDRAPVAFSIATVLRAGLWRLGERGAVDGVIVVVRGTNRCRSEQEKCQLHCDRWSGVATS